MRSQRLLKEDDEQQQTVTAAATTTTTRAAPQTHPFPLPLSTSGQRRGTQRANRSESDRPSAHRRGRDALTAHSRPNDNGCLGFGHNKQNGTKSIDDSDTSILTHTPPNPRPQCRMGGPPGQHSPPSATQNFSPRQSTLGSVGLKTASSPAAGYDKDTPRKPTLASRPISRAPLTPKIASTAAPRTPYSTPGQARDGAGPFIASNVTPRSGTRQSRVDSGSTTPNYGTPTPQNHWDVRPGGGLSPGASTLDERLHSVAAQGGSAANSADSKFFYASDAKPAANGVAAPPAPPSLGPPSRASTFFYASGQSLPSPQVQQQQQAPNAVPPLLSSVAGSSGSSPPDLSSKFLHANGAALDRPHTITPKGPGSVISTPATAHGGLPAKRPAMSSRAPPSAVATTPYGSSQQRPLSPVKRAPVSPFSLQKRGSFPLSNNNVATRATEAPTSQPSISTPTMMPLPSPSAVSPGNGSGRFDLLTRQRTSSSAGGHSRKGSLTIADPPTVARLLQSSQPSSETSSPAASAHFASPSFPFPSTGGSTTTTAATGLAAILQASEDFGDAGADDDGSVSHADSNEQGDTDVPTQQETSATSPGSSSPPTTSHVDELVANARRERKVQDLEIRNASLEAINRSLERQMRKQKSELRQFRRLSRSGRLSLAPSSASAAASRVTSSSSSVYEGPLQDPDRLFSILSEDDSDGAEDGGYDDADDYASDMEVSFNEETAENEDDNDDSSSDTSRQKQRRKRDERRLQLDLSKHRQLLVDSQKINQSIKRCLGWTEALIQEGQKALAFQVRVSEVQLGGRVLVADELEGDGDVMSVVTDSVVGEHAGVVENEVSERKPLTLGAPFVPNTNGARYGEDLDDENGQDSRDEAFSPISQKSRNVHFDMDVLDAIHEKNKTNETSETDKDTAQAASRLEEALTPSEPAPETVPPSTLPSAAANPVPESSTSPEGPSAPAPVPATDSVQAPSLGTGDDTITAQQIPVDLPAAEQLQGGPAREESAETGIQAQTEPMSVEAVAA